MARPKSFNETMVLSQMAQVFWRQGYDATSMRDLEKASQLKASSLYHEFGSKKQLFERTLTFYINTIIGARIDQYLRDQTPPIAGIRAFLVTTFKDVPEPFRHQSCLLVNTAAELGQTDPDIGAITAKGLKAIEKAFAHALQQAQQQGEIAAELDCQLVAQSLTLIMPGLLIAAKNQSKTKSLEQVVDFHLQQISR